MRVWASWRVLALHGSELKLVQAAYRKPRRIEASQVAMESFATALAGHGGLAVAFCCAAISLPQLLSWAPQLRKSLQGFQSGRDEMRLGLAHAHHAARLTLIPSPALSPLSRLEPKPSALQHSRGLGRSLGAVSSDARLAAGRGILRVLRGRPTKATAPQLRAPNDFLIRTGFWGRL